MTHLLLRTVYVTVCILADGLILPLVIIATNRTIISYLLFVPALGLMIFLQHRFYLRWKASWKELVDSNRGDSAANKRA
jgi:glucose-6-phosphate-specific signal transduction histidine kinase